MAGSVLLESGEADAVFCWRGGALTERCVRPNKPCHLSPTALVGNLLTGEMGMIELSEVH